MPEKAGAPGTQVWSWPQSGVCTESPAGLSCAQPGDPAARQDFGNDVRCLCKKPLASVNSGLSVSPGKSITLASETGAGS